MKEQLVEVPTWDEATESIGQFATRTVNDTIKALSPCPYNEKFIAINMGYSSLRIAIAKSTKYVDGRKMELIEELCSAEMEHYLTIDPPTLFRA